MSYAENMKELLQPLGVYKLENSCLGAELECVGAAMDELAEELERIQREMSLVTARGEGLEQTARLFARRPAAQQPEQLAQALAALTRISGDSFTCGAMNQTLAGCGLNARVRESAEVNTVEVRFPDVAGIPEEFDRIRLMVEDILPAHLLVRYLFWYQTWGQMEGRGMTWGDLRELRWDDLEKMVE